MRHLRNLASVELAVGESKGEELVESGIDLVVGGHVLRSHFSDMLKETCVALVEVPFGILQTLSVLGSGLVGLGRSVRVDRAGALHGGCRGWAGDSTSLAAGSFLLLGWGCGRGGLR